MDYISIETRKSLSMVRALAHDVNIELGPALARSANGDCLWLVLTRDDIDAHYILLITGHTFLAEYSAMGREELAVIGDIYELLLLLKKAKYRKLTPIEFEDFTHGRSAKTATASDENIICLDEEPDDENDKLDDLLDEDEPGPNDIELY